MLCSLRRGQSRCRCRRRQWVTPSNRPCLNYIETLDASPFKRTCRNRQLPEWPNPEYLFSKLGVFRFNMNRSRSWQGLTKSTVFPTTAGISLARPPGEAEESSRRFALFEGDRAPVGSSGGNRTRIRGSWSVPKRSTAEKSLLYFQAGSSCCVARNSMYSRLARLALSSTCHSGSGWPAAIRCTSAPPRRFSAP